MFDSFFCDILNGLDCYDYYGEHETGYSSGGFHKTVYVERAVTIRAETQKAYLVCDVKTPKISDGYRLRTGWYPKRFVVIKRRMKKATIVVLDWLVTAKKRDEISDPLTGFTTI
jgi:hypothetical protein